MNNTIEEKKSDGDAINCCSGKSKWIWVALAVALGVIVLGKLANKEPAVSCSGGICPLPVAVTGTNTAPAVAASLPRLVDLGAGKCIPCKLMAPILAEMKKTYAGKLEVQFIDVWESPDEGSKYGVKIIPTQIFYDVAGKELFRHEGFFSREDILAKWKEFGVDLSSTTPATGVSP